MPNSKHSTNLHRLFINSVMVCFFPMFITGCSDSSSNSVNPQSNQLVHDHSGTVSPDEDENNPAIGNSETPQPDSVDNTQSSNAGEPDLFTDEMISPLLVNIQSGSPLSVTNYQAFLSTYYRIAGSQLMQNITLNMDVVSNEIRAALAGEASTFVTESVAGSDVRMEAVLSCPAGGRVSVDISTQNPERVELFTVDIYGPYRDTLSYESCTFNGTTYNGTTTEHHSNLHDTGTISSRRFGGYVYSGGAVGAHAQTNYQDGFGEADEQFSITDANGVSALSIHNKVTSFLVTLVSHSRGGTVTGGWSTMIVV